MLKLPLPTSRRENWSRVALESLPLAASALAKKPLLLSLLNELIALRPVEPVTRYDYAVPPVPWRFVLDAPPDPPKLPADAKY